MSAAFDRIVSEAVRAGTMVGGPSMAPVENPRFVPAPASPPAPADTHHGALLLGVGIGVVLTFAVFTFGRSS